MGQEGRLACPRALSRVRCPKGPCGQVLTPASVTEPRNPPTVPFLAASLSGSLENNFQCKKEKVRKYPWHAHPLPLTSGHKIIRPWPSLWQGQASREFFQSSWGEEPRGAEAGAGREMGVGEGGWSCQPLPRPQPWDGCFPSAKLVRDSCFQI